jgi:hypothetical protein
MPGIYYTRRDKGAILTVEEAMMLDDLMIAHLLPDGANPRIGLPGWDDIVQEVIVQINAPNAPTIQTWRGNFSGYAFAPDAMNECFINFHVRHNYDDAGGATPGMVYPHVHFTVNTASAGTIRWGIEWQYARRADAAGAGPYTDSVTQYIEYTIGAGGKQFWHIVAESPDGAGIPVGSVLQVDSMIKCRVFRDAMHSHDTFPDLAFLDTVDAHVPVHNYCTDNRQFPFNNV